MMTINVQFFNILNASTLKILYIQSNGIPKAFRNFFVYGPLAQSLDQRPFKTTKIEIIYNASFIFISFNTLSYFVQKQNHIMFL